MNEHDDLTRPNDSNPPAEPPQPASHDQLSSVPLGLTERAFFTGMVAAQMATEQIAELPEVTRRSLGAIGIARIDPIDLDGTNADRGNTNPADPADPSGGTAVHGTRDLAAFFWMTIGSRMTTDLRALLAETAEQTGPDRPETGQAPDRAERGRGGKEVLAGLQQAFLHGVMTRTPSWLYPAFELVIPSFDAGPFLDRDGQRVGYEQLRRLVAVALQRTWGRIHDGNDEGPVYLDSPLDATWAQVGTFSLHDDQEGW